MMNEIEQVPVRAYLTPHPLDEFNDSDPEWFTWIPGFQLNTDEDPISDENNVACYEALEKLIERKFKDAMFQVWPLIKRIQFRSLSITIDYSNLLGMSNHPIASFMYELSKITEGTYAFCMHNKLTHYTIKREYENITPIPVFEYTWIHELIHLADHTNILKSSLFFSSENPAENLKYFIIKFREEGIADMFYFLSGNIDIKTLTEAKEVFNDQLSKCKEKLNLLNKTTKDIRSEIYDGRYFYEIGPWLLLDLLLTFEGGYHKDKAEETIINIQNGVFLKNEDIIDLIVIILRIQIDDFLEYINGLKKN